MENNYVISFLIHFLLLLYIDFLIKLNIIFDLLYVNDKSVIDLCLQQRILLLKRCIKPKNKIIEIVEQKEAKTVNDIIDALDNAIMNR